jgi:hypothetical protein
MDTGLYPADQWKPGSHYKAFDWSGYDQDDIPAGAWQQMQADNAKETAHAKPKTEKPAASKFSGLVKEAKTKKTKSPKTP